MRFDEFFSWVLGWVFGSEFVVVVPVLGKFFSGLLVFQCSLVAWWKFYRRVVAPLEVAFRGIGVFINVVWFSSWFGQRNLLFLKNLRSLILMTYDRPLLRLSNITACWSQRLVNKCAL
jgi:hypothetical protein